MDMTQTGTTEAPAEAEICDPCQEERLRWLDTKPSAVLPFGIAHGSGAGYDVTAPGIRDRSRGQHEKWRVLVREQMALIAATCRAAGHSA